MRHFLVGLLLFGCQSGAPIGTTCSRSSDCALPFVCRIGHCRTECTGGRDCPAGQACLIDADGHGACELPTIDVCAVSCDAPLICASGHCRVECATATDCPSGHECTSNACQRIATDVDGGSEDAAMDAASHDAGPHDVAIRRFDAVPDDAGDGGLSCDPVANTGCIGMRCAMVGVHPGCVASGGAADVGQTCSVDADCRIGLSCQGDRCVRVCLLGHNAFCGLDLSCSVDSVSGQTQITTDDGIGFCTEECDLLTDEGCAQGTCALGTNSDGHDFTWCRDIGTTPEGGTCGNEFECARGLGCHAHVCRRFCDLAGGGGCAAAQCTLVTTFMTRPQVGECN